MAFQFILNITIAFVWMFLYNEWTFSFFLVGFIVGALLILVMRRYLPGDYYLRRVWNVIVLLLLLLRELISANILVLKYILQPKLNIKPGIVAVETELKSDFEITLLAFLVTLTPGTLILEISPDNSTLYIHVMDIRDMDIITKSIRGTFERAIMEVTR
ncbi:Na+/H+ antiporter subunit E [Paenibacillaceae bacterium]|nr:Na+/H+ antiporter subunit E [Paenibacillaceae bacterium]